MSTEKRGEIISASKNQKIIAKFINSTDFTNSIPNKIIDSMALGLPLITSLDGVVKKLLTENNVGFYLNYDNFDEIYLNLKLLIDDTKFF